MLVYHPAFDAYHCLFRSIAVLEVSQKCEIERLRILDFCLSFPTIVKDFRLPPGKSGVKKAAAAVSNPYRNPMGMRTLFENLSTIQTSAFSCLAASGLAINESENIVRTKAPLPEGLQEKCLSFQRMEKTFFDVLLNELLALPLLGPDGLKARSGLMEYRYDTI